jgi:hypothetical protein
LGQREQKEEEQERQMQLVPLLKGQLLRASWQICSRFFVIAALPEAAGKHRDFHA